MKKILLFILLLIPVNVLCETQLVTFANCIDGDTVAVTKGKETIKLRLLAIDAPESVHPTKEVEPYGKEAGEYTCHLVTEAKQLTIEYDKEAERQDKYDRHLVWLYADQKLVQEKLIEQGLAKTAYLYGDYKYTPELKRLEKIAQEKKLRIWSNYEEKTVAPWEYIVIGLIIIILCIFSTKYRKKIINIFFKALKKAV